ncbi:MAG: helix-turn-helix domain-containing protein [Candidatus Dormibacteria bacterium]
MLGALAHGGPPVGGLSRMALLTVPEAAAELGVSARFGWELAQRGELPTLRLGRLVRVRPEDLARFCAARVEGGDESAARASTPAAKVEARTSGRRRSA